MKQYLALNHESISSFKNLLSLTPCILEYRDLYNEIEKNNDPHKQDNVQEDAKEPSH